jgi:hypothetical protein
MIDPRFIVKLRDKEYPTWPGVLDAATKEGLKSLTTRIAQIPDPSNGNVAVVIARAEFEDGRVFEDVGDAGPQNCSPQIATAALRMASTRAKGRCLRDALNVGTTMFEELPEEERRGNGNENSPVAVSEDFDGKACTHPGCGKLLTEGQRQMSVRAFGQPLCPADQKHYTRIG